MGSTEQRTTTLRYEPLPGALALDATRTFTDEAGGAPLRCCLRDSRPGERIALVAVTPEGPQGAYRETGPVFLHADRCAGPIDAGYPEEFRRRTQVFRAYDHAGVIYAGEVLGPPCEVPRGAGPEGSPTRGRGGSEQRGDGTWPRCRAGARQCQSLTNGA